MLIEFKKASHATRDTVPIQKEWRYRMSNALAELNLAIQPCSDEIDRLDAINIALKNVIATFNLYESKASEIEGWNHKDFERKSQALNNFWLKEEMYNRHRACGIESERTCWN